MLLCKLIKHRDGLLRHKIGAVEIFWNAVCEDGLLIVHEREWVEVVTDAPYRTPVLFEAAIAGVSIEWCEWSVVKRVLM